jgi:hypothetical protein
MMPLHFWLPPLHPVRHPETKAKAKDKAPHPPETKHKV